MVWKLYDKTNIPVVLFLVMKFEMREGRINLVNELVELGLRDEEQGFSVLGTPDIVPMTWSDRCSLKGGVMS